MKLKRVIRGVLLLYVAASFLSLLAKETGLRRGSAAQEGKPAGLAKADSPVRKVIAYYFHGNFRCRKCRTIEAYAKEAFESGFPEALKDGRLEWRAINVEEPENEHFVKDFELSTRSVVIAEVVDGKTQYWTNLQRVWELVRDKGAFLKYVRDAAQPCLEAEKQ